MRNIVLGKLVDRTIDDDYEELSERLFGEGNCYNSSEVRKRMYGMKAIIDAIDRDKEDVITSSDILSDLEQKKIELEIERKKFSDQRREYNKLISKTSRSENLLERLVCAANNLPHTVGEIEFKRNLGISESTNEAILVLCDWHFGMLADNVWNKYNVDICKERVKRVIDSAVDRILLHECERLHIVVLGDLIHGAIHTSARVASEELVCDQIIGASEVLAQAIEHLSQYVQELYVYTTYGNHARTVQNKGDSIHRDNMERIIPWWLSQRLKQIANVSVIPEYQNEFIVFDACGCGICASHGDLDTVKSSPRLIPALFQKKFGRNIDYILLADKHHRESFEELGVNSLVCGALCGTDEYANSKRLFSTPEQTLLILKPGIGVDAEYHLRCS